MKIKVKGTAVSFFSVIIFLTTTAIATAPCPVCEGKGIINSTPGAEKVSIFSFQDQEFPSQRDVCGVYTIFKHGIKMELLNEGAGEISTWIKLDLVDLNKPEGSEPIDTQYVRVIVPGSTVVDSTFDVYFGSGIDVPGRVVVQSKVVVGGVPDAACGGRGRVSINTWPFTTVLKNSFVESIRQENPYKPPVVIDWEDLIDDPDH